MNLTVTVDRAAHDLGIHSPTICLIRNVHVLQGTDAIDDAIAQLMETLTRRPESILDRPEVQGFRELFAKMGYPKQVPAGERLIDSLRRRGFKKYNNLIDAYNVASATFGSGLGMHDAARLNGDLRVYRADGTESIVPIFKSKDVPIKAGDLLYAHASRPLAWLGERDVDSDEFKITDQTTSLLLVALGNAATSEAYNRAACEMAINLIRATCPDALAEFATILSETG